MKNFKQAGFTLIELALALAAVTLGSVWWYVAIYSQKDNNAPVALKPKRSKPEVSLPADWQPRPEERERAAKDGLDCDSEAEAFRDHHTAKANRMADWNAAFRNWLRMAVKFGRNNRQGSLGQSAYVRKVEEL